MVLSNFLLKDGNVSYTYKKSFDILAEGLNCTIELPLVDEIRTKYYDDIIEIKAYLPILKEIVNVH